MKTWLTLLLLSALFTGCNSGVQTAVNDNETTTQKILSNKDSSMSQKNTFTLLNSGQYPISTEGEKVTTIYHSDVDEDVVAFEKAYMKLEHKKHYILSFSQEKDLLSQWRGYGDNSAGVAIGLHFGLCADILKIPPRNMGATILPQYVKTTISKI